MNRSCMAAFRGPSEFVESLKDVRKCFGKSIFLLVDVICVAQELGIALRKAVVAALDPEPYRASVNAGIRCSSVLQEELMQQAIGQFEAANRTSYEAAQFLSAPAEFPQMLYKAYPSGSGRTKCGDGCGLAE